MCSARCPECDAIMMPERNKKKWIDHDDIYPPCLSSSLNRSALVLSGTPPIPSPPPPTAEFSFVAALPCCCCSAACRRLYFLLVWVRQTPLGSLSDERCLDALFFPYGYKLFLFFVFVLRRCFLPLLLIVCVTGIAGVINLVGVVISFGFLEFSEPSVLSNCFFHGVVTWTGAGLYYCSAVVRVSMYARTHACRTKS